MSARERLSLMIRTDPGDRTVWSLEEMQGAIDAHRAEVLRKAADDIDADSSVSAAVHAAAKLRCIADTAEPSRDEPDSPAWLPGARSR